MSDSLLVVSLDDISPNPWNPHRMTAEQFEGLRESLKEDGQWRPILVVEMDVPDEATPVIKTPYRIVDGEHLYRALLRNAEEGEPDVARIMLLGNNSEIPLWKQKEIGQVINHGLRGTEEDPVKTAEVMSDILRHKSPEAVAKRIGFGTEAVKRMAAPPGPIRKLAAPSIKSTPYTERKNYHLALIFETAADLQSFEDLVQEVGTHLSDKSAYKGRMGQYRIDVLSKALLLAREQFK